MKQSKKGHQRSRLRVDPFTLLQLLTEQDCTLSELQQRTGFDPAEMKALRAARSIRLDTLNRLSAGLNVSPNSLLVTPDSPWTVNHCDSQTQEYGFQDAFNIIVDYSPYYEAPLFKLVRQAPALWMIEDGRFSYPRQIFQPPFSGK